MKHNTLHGVLWMSGAVLCFSTMAIAVRQLLTHMGIFEVLFFRTFIALLAVIAYAGATGFAPLRTGRIGVHTLRNVTHFGGQYCWVYAIGMLPLATVFALEFTMPVWVALLAYFILGERLTGPRLVMLVSGLAGVVVILKPGASATEEELVAWGREQMAAYKYPRIVKIVESLPMTATGKLLKRELS